MAQSQEILASAFGRIVAGLPPDGPDRLLRVLDDAHHLQLTESLWSVFVGKGDKSAAGRLLDDIQATRDRQAAEAPFILRLARAVGEEGFEAALSEAERFDGQELTRLRERAHRDHAAILPFVEEQLTSLAGTWAQERGLFRAQNDEAAIAGKTPPVLLVSNGVQTAVGVADIVIGVATIALGASLAAEGELAAGAAFVAVGGFEVAYGAHLLGAF